MTDRLRTFVWAWGLRGPQPQILFEPRVGCEATRILVERKLDPADTRSLNELARDYPAPEIDHAA